MSSPPQLCPHCQAELPAAQVGSNGPAAQCSSCGWSKPNRVQVTRLTEDLAITPEGQPNMTRKQFLEREAAKREAGFEDARARARAVADIRKFDEGGGDALLAMSELALCFHALRAAHALGELQGVRPWDPEVFWSSALGALHDTGSLQAAAFVLHVWNPSGAWTTDAAGRRSARQEAEKWREPDPFEGSPAPLPFDHGTALTSWDSEHRGAYLGWAERPWWG